MVKTDKEILYVCEVCGGTFEIEANAEICEKKGVKDHTLPIGTLVTNDPKDMLFRVKEHKTFGHDKHNIIEFVNGKTMGGSGFYEASFTQIKRFREWVQAEMPEPSEVECPKCGKPVSPKWAKYALRLLCNQYDHDSDEGFDEEFE